MNAVDEFTGTGRIDLLPEAREHQGIGIVVDASLGLHGGRTGGMADENNLGEPVAAQRAALERLNDLMQLVGLILYGGQLRRRLVTRSQAQPVEIQGRISGAVGRIDE